MNILAAVDDEEIDSDSSDVILEEFAFDLEERGMIYLQSMAVFDNKANAFSHTAAAAMPLVSSVFVKEELPKLRTFLQSVDEMSDSAFFSHFRLTRSTYSRLLEHVASSDQITDTLNDGGQQPIGPKAALYMTLAYLGKKCPYGEIATMFGVSKSTVYKHTFTILKTIALMTQQEVKWPTFEQYAGIEHEFRQICGFPGIIGVVDACRVSIKAPHTDYLGETERHSMTLLGVCDARKRFTSVHVAYPGNTHDQEVLTYSPLGKAIDALPQSLFPNEYHHIIGDEAFSLSTHVMVPYRENEYLHIQQRNYNLKLGKTRSVIDSAFWWLKGRFRRLLYIDAEYDRIPVIITAACVLHNIALDLDEESELLMNDIKSFTLDNPWQMGFIGYEGNDMARAKRDHLAHSC